jgi:hypothetical protein
MGMMIGVRISRRAGRSGSDRGKTVDRFRDNGAVVDRWSSEWGGD